MNTNDNDQMSTSDTPRTGELPHPYAYSHEAVSQPLWNSEDMIDYAKQRNTQLERELAAVTKERDELKEVVSFWFSVRPRNDEFWTPKTLKLFAAIDALSQPNEGVQ